MCSDGNRIPASKVCDATYNCADGGDEMFCDGEARGSYNIGNRPLFSITS